MRPIDLPMVSPGKLAQHISANDVVRILRYETIPGLDVNDPRVRAIQRARIHNWGRVTLTEARRRGFLYLARSASGLPDEDRGVETVWGFWCAAAHHPDIRIIVERDDLVRIRCDVSSTGSEWSFDDFIRVAAILRRLECPQEVTWIFTTDELQIDGLMDIEAALYVAEGLVDITTAGRIRPEGRTPPQRASSAIAYTQHVPMERSDWNGSQRK